MTLILQIVTIMLVVFVPAVLYRTAPSWWTVAGCVAYTLSYFISNIWHVAFWVLDPLPPEIAASMQNLMQDAPASAYGFALRLYQAGTLLLVAVYSGIVFLALRSDLQARLVWMVLWIAESFALLEYAECKMLVDPFGSSDLHLSTVWGIEVSRYACGRAFGSLTVFAAPVITSLYALWIVTRFRHERPDGN